MEHKDIEVPFSDWALEDWVVYANEYGMEIGVTLQIGGFLVSGKTASGGEFLRNMGESLSEATMGAGDKYKEISEMLKNMYEKQAQNSYPQISLEESESSKKKQSTREPSFIHLKQVAIFTDSQISPIQVKYWRGKLASVDAWFLGTMSKY
jgi:hypothetical protein